VKRIYALAIAFFFIGGLAWGQFPVSIITPNSAIIDAIAITAGTFFLQSATSYNDSGGTINSTNLAAQLPLSFGMTMGNGARTFLLTAPAGTEVLNLVGLFIASAPEPLQAANYDIWFGVTFVQDVALRARLPATTDQALSYQITDLGPTEGLGDNTDVFSSTVPVLTLTTGTTGQPNEITLDNGVDNQWFVGYTTSPLTMTGDGAITLPVEMTSFTATQTQAGVLIRWRTESETNNIGFNLYRSLTKGGTFTKVGFVEGHGSTPLAHDYTFIDGSAKVGQTYFYQIEDIDILGNHERSKIIRVIDLKGQLTTTWGEIKSKRR